MSRPETGKMKFGDDWSGVFIRGDAAFAFAQALEAVIAVYAEESDGCDEVMITREQIENLADLLRSAAEKSNAEPQAMKPFDECKNFIDIEIPPESDLDENGNYTGKDPRFTKSL